MTTREQKRAEKISAIYEKIANKELDFGCKVKTRGGIYRVTSESEGGVGVTNGINKLFLYYGESSFRIIGHPVMIGDVLDYIDKNGFRGQEINGMIEIDVEAREKWVIGLYNYCILKHNKPIEEQSDECIDYIYNLLGNE